MSKPRSSGVEDQQQRLLRHVVLFRWKDDTPEEKIHEIEQTFCELPNKIKQIQSFEWGTDVSVEGKSKEMSHCFLVSFASAEDRDVYLPHPAHEAFSALAKPYVKDVLVLDYWRT